MAVLKPRNRLVYFRVTEEEFQVFSDICLVEGARSISDLARVALQRLVRDRKVNAEEHFLERLRLIDEVLTELSQKVERLNTRLGPHSGDDQRVAFTDYSNEVSR